MNTGKVVIGTLAGVAAGALLGILFAPEKGAKTRKSAWHTAEDLVSKRGKKGQAGQERE